VAEWWSGGFMERKNKNRGYKRLRVWQDAVTLYVETCRLFKSIDGQAFRLENSLLRLIESLERKRDSGTWTETLIINESNSIYTTNSPE
jgi:hypothetical protein